MSAGMGSAPLQVDRDMSRLAPNFRKAVEDALADCRTAGYDAVVYEGFRTMELQRLYYARGRTTIPPTRPVTNAASNLYSWHGFGLAIDVVDAKYYWTPPKGEEWFKEVAAIFKAKNLCRWGGDWAKPDTPHFQWHLCKPSPSDEARRILAQDGLEAVWKALDAA